jgi:DNA repair protein RadC
LLGVANELVATLVASINSEKIDPKYLAEIVKRLGNLKKVEPLKPQQLQSIKAIEPKKYYLINQQLAKTRHTSCSGRFAFGN